MAEGASPRGANGFVRRIESVGLQQREGGGMMKGLNLKIFLKILLHALLIWIYTYLLVDFAMRNNYPNYVFGIFVLGLGLGYFIAKIKFEKA